jgi:hypothetical protein
MPTMDIPHTGRVSSIADPGGAVLSAFQVAEPERQSWGLRGKDGHFCWTELLTQDAERAKDFYKQVVGWEILEADMDGTAYCMLMPPGGKPEEAQGGIMQMEKPDVPDGWLPYVGVQSADETAAKAKELGATLCVEPVDIGSHGRSAVIIDPQGAVFGIYQSMGGADC